MDKNDIFNLAEEFACDFKNSEDFLKLNELKKRIDNELAPLVIDFKNKRDKYHEFSASIKNTPSLKYILDDFIKAKELLYSEQLVKDYFILERSLQTKLNELSKELLLSVTNRFR